MVLPAWITKRSQSERESAVLILPDGQDGEPVALCVTSRNRNCGDGRRKLEPLDPSGK